MKHYRTGMLICFLLCVSLSAVIASPVAEHAYRDLRSLDLDTLPAEQIISSYEVFYDRISGMAENARNDMLAARASGDREAYRSAYDRLVALSAYRMGEEETEALLARFLEEPEEKQVAYAQWLYRMSTCYRPLLTIDYSYQDEQFRYAFTQRIHQVPGSEITLPAESHLRVHTSRLGILSGWGITKDQVTYAPGETIPMPLTSQTLYAIWSSAVRFSDPITETEITRKPVSEGSEIEVPVLESPDPDYRFIGWYDRSTRELLDDETTYTVHGNGAVFEALWKHIAVESIVPLYYGFDRIPTEQQVFVGFSITNEGNFPVRNITVTASSDSPYVTMEQESVSVGDLPARRYRTHNSRFAQTDRPMVGGEANTLRFVVEKSAPSQTAIPLTLTISDGEDVWKTEVTFIVR